MPAQIDAYSYVRMSTGAQLKGDSLHRQVRESERFAAEKGWRLVKDLPLHDIGVSAFTGKNLQSGALATFIDAVNNGLVKRGSYLIIESLDRFSRDTPYNALPSFMSVLASGINIVTLIDRQIYEAGSQDHTKLLYSMVLFIRAHDESKTKSVRLSSAWARKRKYAETRKLTSLCPAWLTLSGDRRSFAVNQVRADVIRRIFDETVRGVGAYTIARRLNSESVPTFGRSNGWQASYVKKILANRAAIGEFQPHRLTDGDRVAEGEPIPDYFPAIISRDIFYRAAEARKARRVGHQGRKGHQISNLFSGLARCGYCGSHMHFINKGAPPKGGRYLLCDSANRGLHCERVLWRYDHFEASFLAFVSEIDLASIAKSGTEASQLKEAQGRVVELSTDLDRLRQTRQRIFDAFMSDDNPSPYAKERYDAIEADIARQQSELRAAKRDLDSSGASESVADAKNAVKALIQALGDGSADDVYLIRAEVFAKLRRLVDCVLLFPAGTLARKGKIVPPPASDRSARSRRWFAALLKNGRRRVASPSQSDPLMIQASVSTDDGSLRGSINDKPFDIPAPLIQVRGGQYEYPPSWRPSANKSSE